MEIGDVVQVRFFSELGDQVAINVRHWRVTAKAGLGASPQQFAAIISTSVGPSIKALMAGTGRYAGCEAQVIWPLLGTPFYSQGEAGNGSVAGDVLPKQTSGLLSLRTTLGGRKNRGRFYAPFPCELDNTPDAKPSNAYIVELNTLGSLLVQPRANVGVAPDFNTLLPVIYHRADHTTTDLTTGFAADRWATQRRRGDYGRPNTLPVGL